MARVQIVLTIIDLLGAVVINSTTVNLFVLRANHR